MSESPSTSHSSSCGSWEILVPFSKGKLKRSLTRDTVNHLKILGSGTFARVYALSRELVVKVYDSTSPAAATNTEESSSSVNFADDEGEDDEDEDCSFLSGVVNSYPFLREIASMFILDEACRSSGHEPVCPQLLLFRSRRDTAHIIMQRGCCLDDNNTYASLLRIAEKEGLDVVMKELEIACWKALAFVHAMNIMHRDIKPANMVLAGRPVVKGNAETTQEEGEGERFELERPLRVMLIDWNSSRFFSSSSSSSKNEEEREKGRRRLRRRRGDPGDDEPSSPAVGPEQPPQSHHFASTSTEAGTETERSSRKQQKKKKVICGMTNEVYTAFTRPPELCRSVCRNVPCEYDDRADVWAMGMAMLNILTKLDDVIHESGSSEMMRKYTRSQKAPPSCDVTPSPDTYATRAREDDEGCTDERERQRRRGGGEAKRQRVRIVRQAGTRALRSGSGPPDMNMEAGEDADVHVPSSSSSSSRRHTRRRMFERVFVDPLSTCCSFEDECTFMCSQVSSEMGRFYPSPHLASNWFERRVHTPPKYYKTFLETLDEALRIDPTKRSRALEILSKSKRRVEIECAKRAHKALFSLLHALSVTMGRSSSSSGVVDADAADDSDSSRSGSPSSFSSSASEEESTPEHATKHARRRKAGKVGRAKRAAEERYVIRVDGLEDILRRVVARDSGMVSSCRATAQILETQPPRPKYALLWGVLIMCATLLTNLVPTQKYVANTFAKSSPSDRAFQRFMKKSRTCLVEIQQTPGFFQIFVLATFFSCTSFSPS